MDSNKIKDYCNHNYKLIFSHIFNYGFILVFPAFGPILNKLVGVEQGILLGSVFLFFLIISIFTSLKKFETNPIVVKGLVSVNIVVVILFPFTNGIMQYILLALLGYTTGRYTVFFCYSFMNHAHPEDYSKILAIILTLSYAILYISNVFVPTMSVLSVVIWCIAILIGAMVFAPIPDFNVTSIAMFKKHSLPFKNLLVIFLIFITAGTTYAGIYPRLKQYAVLERFYNIIPFLFAAAAAAFIADKFGRKILVYFGVSAIGLAFIFSFLPPGAIAYLLVQTCLQIGWAFLDAYAWFAGTDYAARHNQPIIIAFFVGAFLSGTYFGTILNIIFNNIITDYSGFIGNLLTFFPLFIVFLFVPSIEETLVLKDGDENKTELFLNELFSDLTPREREVADLLLLDITNEEISNQLFISPNTLKKHARSIYKKAGVQNKRELKNIVQDKIIS